MFLQSPPPFRFINSHTHGIGEHIRVHDYPPLRISGRTPDGLNQGSFRTEKSFLVRVQYGHQRDLRNIQALPQQVDSHQHIEHIQTHIPDNFRPFQGVNIRMQIFYPDPQIPHIIGQLLRHPLGKCGDENFVVIFHFFIDLSHQIINLPFHRPHLHLGIQKPGGTDNLLRPEHFMIFLIFSRRRRHKQHLIHPLLKFREIQWPIVLGRRKSEPVIHQRGLSGLVPGIHSPDLGNRLVGLIDNDQIIISEIVHQRIRRLPRFQPGQMAGIVFNPGAEPGLFHHLNVEIGSLIDPLGLQKLVLAFEILHLLFQLCLNVFGRLQNPLHGHHIVGSGIKRDMIQLSLDFPGERVDLHNPVNLIPEKLHPDRHIRFIGRNNLHHIPPHPEGSPVKIHIVPVILHIDQLPQHLVPILLHAGTKGNDHILVVLGTSDTVNTGYAGHDDHVPALGERRGGRKTQPVNLIVDG